MQKFNLKFFIYIPVFFLIFLLVGPSTAFAQATDSISLKTDSSSLKVGLAGSSPFIVKTNDHYGGISYEIWEALAAKSKWKYSTQYFNSVTDGISALQNGGIDVLVGPVSITSDRAKVVRFSQPYFQSSLSIMSNSDRHGFWDRIAPFFSAKLLIAIAIFLFILSIVGTLMWLAERKASPEQFPMKPAEGIANGMWLAIVTMTTTGYGDRAPITFWGRIITGSWMVISIIFATTMVAGIASTLTLTGIQTDVVSNMEQLSGKKVAIIKGSPAKDFVEEYFGRPVEVDNLEAAYEKLKSKDVAAVVYDRPQMMYFLKKHGEENMKVSKAEYYKQGYGFAVRENSPLTRKINILLLDLSEENRLTRIVQTWLGDENKDM